MNTEEQVKEFNKRNVNLAMELKDNMQAIDFLNDRIKQHNSSWSVINELLERSPKDESVLLAVEQYNKETKDIKEKSGILKRINKRLHENIHEFDQDFENWIDDPDNYDWCQKNMIEEKFDDLFCGPINFAKKEFNL